MEVLVRPKPLAICDVCHAVTDRHEYLNQRCHEVVNGRRCYGRFKSAIGSLWDRCEACGGKGRVGTRACGECSGFGWKLYG